MGQCLVMAVATELIVYRKSSRWNTEYTKEQLLNSTKVHFDLDLYDMKETDNAIEFYIKPNIFVEYIYIYIHSRTNGFIY